MVVFTNVFVSVTIIPGEALLRKCNLVTARVWRWCEALLYGRIFAKKSGL